MSRAWTAGGRLHGRVTDFHEPRGLGRITADDGRRLPFHCAAVADGSRRIAVGTAVEFDLAPGPLGQWQATAISRVSRA